MSDESSTDLGAQGARKPDFFSEHPEFFETSQTGAHPDRLRARHRAIIEHNVAIIAKRSILDIASHDGRWSLAALEAGASYVHGVEARAELVQKSLRMMEQYGVPREKYSFTVADVHDHLRSIEPGSVDTIFCLSSSIHAAPPLLVQQFNRIGATCHRRHGDMAEHHVGFLQRFLKWIKTTRTSASSDSAENPRSNRTP
jgi:predicted RNA methylase